MSNWILQYWYNYIFKTNSGRCTFRTSFIKLISSENLLIFKEVKIYLTFVQQPVGRVPVNIPTSITNLSFWTFGVSVVLYAVVTMHMMSIKIYRNSIYFPLFHPATEKSRHQVTKYADCSRGRGLETIRIY